MDPGDTHELFRLFADALDYPRPETLRSAAECVTLLDALEPEAATLVQRFADFLSRSPRGRVEEVYTSTFDMNITHAPYLGYHLFGETYKRSSFMISLRERYKESGFQFQGVELPDHVAVLLQFLYANRDAKVEQEIIRDALLPALRKMISSKPLDKDTFPRDGGPYKDLERALLLVLELMTRGWNVEEEAVGEVTR